MASPMLQPAAIPERHYQLPVLAPGFDVPQLKMASPQYRKRLRHRQ
jgi:hypothetical protein